MVFKDEMCRFAPREQKLMSPDPIFASERPAPLPLPDRLELANRLFREYHTRCFWHCPHDLVITQDLIPVVVKGLRQHGGRTGFMLAGKLEGVEPGSQTMEPEPKECL